MLCSQLEGYRIQDLALHLNLGCLNLTLKAEYHSRKFLFSILKMLVEPLELMMELFELMVQLLLDLVVVLQLELIV